MKEKVIKEIKAIVKGEEDHHIFPDDENAESVKKLLVNIYGDKNVVFENIITKRKRDNGN